MRFEKWQALGNDYLILEAEALAFPLTPAASGGCARATSARARTGCSRCIRPDAPGFVARLRIFNPDGSEAELSGNGAREAILYLRRRGWTDDDSVHDPDRRRPDPAADHGSDDVPGGHGARPAALEGLSGRGRGRTGRGRRATPSSTSRSATRSARSGSPTRTSSSGSTWPRSVPASSAIRASPTAPTCRSSPSSRRT